MSCEGAIEKAKVADSAVTAGAIRETVRVIDVEDEALAYYPGSTSRLKIRVVGGLRSEQ